MNREDVFRPIVTMPVDPARGPTPYHLLLRQSRKLGSLATKAHNMRRTLLPSARHAPAQHPDTILFGGNPAAPGVYHQTVDSLIQQSHQVLAEASTVILPNNLFPDTVVVDRTKVTITRRFFFWSSETISIRIEDILNVSVSVGPLFGSLTVSSRVMNSTDHYEINYFWRNDALRLKHIIQGYVIALHTHTELDHMSLNELIATLNELGHNPSA